MKPHSAPEDAVHALQAAKAAHSLTLTLIVAQALNGVIGRDGGIPWRIPEDLKHFKETTLGGALLMGRKTYESIGRPLPGRTTIVLSTRPQKFPEGVRTAASPAAALEAVPPGAVAHVVGGAQIYEQFLPAADRLYVTLVKQLPSGDARFDVFERLDPAQWKIAERRALTNEAELFTLTRI